MFESRHPEVLARDWLPPVALGREAQVAEVVRRLDPPQPRAPPPWVVTVAGPHGSGVSTVARRAARAVADQLRAAGGTAPRVLPVRVAGLRGTHGVACALLRLLDPGFDGRGFPVVEIVAGFLRRLRREARATVIVLDDVGLGSPDLGPILRALGAPDRFLPEGESGLPSTWTIIAGTPEGLRAVDPSVGLGRPVTLVPYTDRQLQALVRDRAERSLGRPVPPEVVERVVARAVEDGASASVALDRLRRELIGPGRPGSVATAWGARSIPVPVEPHVVRAIEAAVRGHEAGVADVRRREAELAQAQGDRPLPPTTLWRRIVRLEQAGYVRREIRPGGLGGTRSVVRLLTPVDEWLTSDLRPESRPVAGSWGASRWTETAAVGSSRAGAPAPTLPPLSARSE